MGIGKQSDLTIYEAQFALGLMESQAQAVEGVAANSRGAINIGFSTHIGQYKYESYFNILDDIARRDETSVAAQTATPLTDDESISVKVLRKLPLRQHNIHAFKTKGFDKNIFFQMAGRNYGELKQADMLNTGVLALEAALAESGNTLDKSSVGGGSSNKTISHGNLNAVTNKFGDRSQKIMTWLMHSNSVFGLTGQTLTDKIVNVADPAIKQNQVFAMGRPILESDIPALTDAAVSVNPVTYNVLGLVTGALIIEESEPDEVWIEPVTGTFENLVVSYQAEYAFTITIKGFKWDVGNGGSNPTDANLGTESNWDQHATSIKDTAGVRLKVDVSV